jgi:biotin transport system substrate-specific component
MVLPVIDDTQVQHPLPAARSTDATPAAGSPKPRGGADARSVALVAVFTAVLVAAAVLPGIPVGGFGVPITLQTLAVLLTGLVLGAWRGGLAVLLYLVLGFVGLPVFSGGASGLQVMSGPTAGYLVSFPVAAVVAGFAAAAVVCRTRRSLWVALLSASAVATSVVVIHSFGVAGLMLNAKLPLGAAIAADLPFLPGDIVKAVVAGVAASAVHRAFPDVLVRRARPTS